MPEALVMAWVLCACQEQLSKSGLWGGGRALVGGALSPTHVGESVFSPVLTVTPGGGITVPML